MDSKVGAQKSVLGTKMKRFLALLLLLVMALPGQGETFYFGWPLNDNAASTTVTGTYVNGTSVGYNTSALAATLGSEPAFRLNYDGATVQYLTASLWAVPIRECERTRLWTKYAGNPVLGLSAASVHYGQLAANPEGGWYWFGSNGATGGIDRWSSADLITWTGQTTALAKATAGAWDGTSLNVPSTFQDPLNDNQWIMLYRGYNGAAYHIGIAYSDDGATFTRKDNGGVDDGLFPQFGDNYDPTGVILVGDRYYVYVNGTTNRHGVTSVYYSDDDCATFTSYSGNPIFQNNMFCPCVWQYGDYYYMLIPRDVTVAGQALYDHAIALYRCSDPYFALGTREFLGYPIVNDQTYDSKYLDTPSLPATDVYRTSFPEAFGDTLYVLYDGQATYGKQCLATTSLSGLASLPALTEPLGSLLGVGGRTTYSWWMQFDSLAQNDVLFGISYSGGNVPYHIIVLLRTLVASQYLAVRLADGYHLTSAALSTGTPYHFVIVDDAGAYTIYQNGSSVATFTAARLGWCTQTLYLGRGNPDRDLHAYLQDFRIYPRVLSQNEVTALYTIGPTHQRPAAGTGGGIGRGIFR